MTAERWRQVKVLFDGALECDPEIRAQWLHENCAGDSDLQQEVESLLAADQQPESPLNTPVFSQGLIGEGFLSAPAPAIDPMIGRQIGNYVITGVLAQGGMGIVYKGRLSAFTRLRPLKQLARTFVRDSAARHTFNRRWITPESSASMSS